MKPAKIRDGLITQEHEVSEVVDDTSATLAFVKLFTDGHVGVLWSPVLFMKGTEIPDDLREMLVVSLRYHADRLEDRSIDARMKEVMGKQRGEA